MYGQLSSQQHTQVGTLKLDISGYQRARRRLNYFKYLLVKQVRDQSRNGLTVIYQIFVLKIDSLTINKES